MESLFVLLATSLVLRIGSSTFRRYLIGNTRCTALLPRGAQKFHINYTPEGDKMYFNDSEINGVGYGLICIDMKDVHTSNEAQNILWEYLNKLNKPFGIAHALPVEVEKTGGIIILNKYWQDYSGQDWKARGYTNGKTVAVLYVKNISDAPVTEHDAFLNSFRFSSAG